VIYHLKLAQGGGGPLHASFGVSPGLALVLGRLLEIFPGKKKVKIYLGPFLERPVDHIKVRGNRLALDPDHQFGDLLSLGPGLKQSKK